MKKRLFIILLASAAALLTSCSDVARRQIHVRMLMNEGTNMVEIYLKRGKYVLQVKEDGRPSMPFSVEATIQTGDQSLTLENRYSPSESSDGVMKVFNMSQDGKAKVNISFTPESKRKEFYLSIGPYQ